MLIRHLDFFITLAEEAHFGRAAALCGVSQPALSQAIRKLEEDLGTPLILRGQRFMGLTIEGEKALSWGRQILADYGNLRADLTGRRKGGLTGVLRIGIAASAAPLLAGISERFEQANPLARIRAELLTASQITDGLAAQTLDAGLGWIPARPPKGAGTFQALAQGTLKFACRADHPFAAGGAISLADAATQPLCLTDDLPAALTPDRPPAVLCASLDTVLLHLRSGGWCSLVPVGFARLLAPDDTVRLVDLGDKDTAPMLGAQWIRRTPPSPMVRAFEDMLATLPGPEQP